VNRARLDHLLVCTHERGFRQVAAFLERIMPERVHHVTPCADFVEDSSSEFEFIRCEGVGLPPAFLSFGEFHGKG